MARIWEPQPITVYQSWLEAIFDEASDNLNDWENSFIDSISNQLISGRNLTQPQAEKLEQIYTKHTK